MSDTGYRMFGAGAQGRSRERIWGAGGRGVQDWELMYTHG